MKTSWLRQPEVDAASPDEPDFPLPVADPSIRPMHRACSGVLIEAASCSMPAGPGCYLPAADSPKRSRKRVRTNDATEVALLKENMLLVRDVAVQREQLAALSARVSATPPAEREPDKAVSPPKAAPEPRRAAPPPKPSPQNAVPESEKWWNRP
jgi:hypothetical protein